MVAVVVVMTVVMMVFVRIMFVTVLRRTDCMFSASALLTHGKDLR